MTKKNMQHRDKDFFYQIENIAKHIRSLRIVCVDGINNTPRGLLHSGSQVSEIEVPLHEIRALSL